jgi:single-stranded-DNA-specific exonuclease
LTDGPALFGVERSVSGRRWRLRQVDERMALALAQRLEAPEILGRVLAARGVGLDEAPAFLEPRLKDALPDPSAFQDMDKAARRLADAVLAHEPIAVFGDYDVDGATSTALLERFFSAVGARVLTYIPDRAREGYGPNIAALQQLYDQGARVVVTVDCGTGADTVLTQAQAAGIEVIVVDHHQPGERLPPAFAVVNPSRLDERPAHRGLAAVGVAFLLAIAVNRRLRQEGRYAARDEPDLLQHLDLVALGTVADLAPLTGLNRVLVKQGLKVMHRRLNPGLTALADVAGMKEPASAYHLGFLLGPRVNAGGRVGEAGLGARLLASDDAAEAQALARRLDGYNRERRTIEGQVVEGALARLAATGDDPGAMVLVASRDWHAGVIGIVASRLQERFHRPAAVVAIVDGPEGQAIGKGSARSSAGFDIGAAVIAARQAGLLLDGGGHAGAAGFSVAEEKIGALTAFLQERAAAARDGDKEHPVPELECDATLAASGATAALGTLLERLAPFGIGNPEPRFGFEALAVTASQIVGGAHLRCVLADPWGNRLPAIAFRCVDTPLGAALQDRSGRPLHVCGKLRPAFNPGRNARPRVELHLEDAAPAS